MPKNIYRLADGTQVPSVTTITGRFKSAEGLLNWANQVGRQGITLDDARQPAADAGTIAHTLVEAHVTGRPAPVLEGSRDVIAAGTRAFETFLLWLETTEFRVLRSEIKLVSERHRFGGQIDAVGLIDGSNALCLADWKSANKLYADNLLQLAGYEILWNENNPDPITGGVHLLRFSRERADFTHAYFSDLSAEKETFLLMRELYDRMRHVEKRLR